MVVDQIRQIDTSGDNQIDENELREAIKPNGFLYKEENLQALGNLLNNGGVEGADQELLSSLEQSFYTLKTNILKKDKITEEEKKLLIVYKNILGGKCDDELKEINDFIKHQEEIERQEQEIQMQEQENTRIYNEILQEVETEISATQDNYIENLISLGIKPNTQLNRNKLRENIKTLDDIEKIDETNIKEYIKIPDDVPSANYEYIANNIKIILNVHLQLHPNWKSIVGKGGLAINMDIGNLLDNNRYLSKIIKEINGIQDIDQQISFCINKFPDGNYLDLCLKRILSSKKYKPEDISKKIFEKIPIQKSENFFKTCDKNPFINGLKSDYVLYWLNKNNSIKTGENYCFLDWTNKSKFDNYYGEEIKLSDDLSFDQLYEYTNEFYKQLNNIGLADPSIPIGEIMSFIKFKESKDNDNKKLQKERDKEISNNNSTPIVGNPESIAIGHVNLNKSTYSVYSEKMGKNCLAIDTEYVKLLLKGKNKPTGKVQPISGADYVIDFSKGKDPVSIIRDSWKEKIGDQRDKFKYDLKNDRQAAFGSLTGMMGGIAGSAATAIFTKNIWATSAGFTAGLRLGNGIGQELWNSGEYLYEQISGNRIDDGNNGVQSFGQGFLRGVGALDQNYEYVGTEKFLSGLGFDYLSTVATFGLSQKFGGFLGKLEGVKFAGGALKFGMEELILENFFVDIPMNIIQTGFETFTGIDDGVTIGNTAIGNQHTIEGQGGYKSGSLSDMLRAMKDATTQNLSLENLSQTFFNTVLYGGFLEGGGAAIKKMKGYLPTGQVSNFTEKSAAASVAFAGLTKFMSEKNINFNKDGVCIDTKTNLKIEEFDPRFNELIIHIRAVDATKAGVIESFEAIMDTQKQMVSDPENRTGLLFRLGLISPTNTPLNILKKKKELVEKKLNEAKAKGDNNKVNQLQKLLDIYTDAETKLNNSDYFDGKSKKLFEGDGTQARGNSEMMDNLLNEVNKEGITETEITEKLGELRKEISEQYKQTTGEELNLTDEQLLSILDAHEQDGILGELTLGQLKQKVKILSETVTDPKIRRFLLEAGFCGKAESITQVEYSQTATDSYTKFLETNTEIQTKIENGKFEFMGKNIEELYKRGLDATLEGKPESQHESLIFDFNTRFANSLEFLSDKESTVKFLDSKTGKLVEGTITDYGKNLLGENFESSPTKKAFFDKLKASMFYQHLDNPLKYCSHGADHSILVDRYVQNIVESYPDVVNKVQEKYGVNEEGARQLLRLTAVFHDFGYPDIGGLAKAMHGPFGGAHFINEFASSSNSTFTDFIKNDLGITDQTKIDQLVNDMRDAIFFHSADKVEKGYLNKIIYTKGQFLIGDNFSAEGTNDFIEILNRESDGVMTITYRSEEGRINAENFKKKMLERYPSLDGNKIKIEEDTSSYDYDEEFDYKKDENGNIMKDEDGNPIRLYEYHGRKGKTGDSGIEFQPIDLLTDPLAGIVRLADNMDMSFDRLTKIQSHPIFMNLFYNIGYEYKLENGETNTETASYIYQKMEKLNKLDKKLKDGEITQEIYNTDRNQIGLEVQLLIEQANSHGGLELTIFDEKTGRPKEGNSKFRVPFEGDILKPGGKVDLYTYKQFIIDAMAKHEGIELNNPDIQTIQNIAIDNDIGSYSFRHFIGLTPVKDVTMFSEGGYKKMVVEVDKNIYLNPELRSQKLTEGSFKNRPVVEYHIWRLFDASGRVQVDGDLLQLEIIDKESGERIGFAERESATDKFDIQYTVELPK